MNIDLDLWKKRKQELHLTFDELAEISNVSRRQLLYLFKGEGKNTGIETVKRIERALGLDNEIPTIPDYTPSEEEKQIFEMIMSMTEEEVDELSNFVDYILSKRK